MFHKNYNLLIIEYRDVIGGGLPTMLYRDTLTHSHMNSLSVRWW